MAYQTFSDMVKDVGGNLDGTKTGEVGQKMANFYAYWSNYLEPTPVYLTYFMAIPGSIGKALYSITASLEHVFNNMFKLFGLFGYLGDTSTIIGQIYFWLQVLGASLFTLVLVFSLITGVFTKPVKYKEAIITFLVVTFCTSWLPMGITTFSNALASDTQNVQTLSADGKSKETASLAIQPMKNNVVDLKILVDKDFNTDLFPLDNQGYIKPVKEGSTAVNNITDADNKRDSLDYVNKIDFTANYGVSNVDFVKDWQKSSKTLSGLQGLFQHKLNANNDGVDSINQHRVASGLNAFEAVYLRYKVNWVAMYAQYIILIILFISMSVKLVKSVFDILIQAMISPILGYSSLRVKKYKELLLTIGGALAGIFFEVIIMRVTLEVCRDLPTLSVSAVSKLSGGFFDGLNMWEQAIAASLVYLGVFLGAMQGVTMIERWLGVSTSQSDTAQQLMGAMMMGNAFATGTAGAGSMAMSAGRFAGNVATSTPGKVYRGAGNVAKGLSATGGGLKGAFNSAKDQGVKGALQGGAAKFGGLTEDKINEKLDKLSQAAQTGHDSVYSALHDPTGPLPDGEKFAEAAHRQEAVFGSGGQGEAPNLDSSSPSSSTSPSPAGSSRQGGITDPSTKVGNNRSGASRKPASRGGISEKTQTPRQPKAGSGMRQSLQKAQLTNQQMNMVGQKLFGGQNHIKGAESDDHED